MSERGGVAREGVRELDGRVEASRSAEGPAAGSTLVLSSTFPQYAGDPRGAFILRFWERRARATRVTFLVPHTAWSRGDLQSSLRIRRFAYAPRSLSSLTGRFGILENIREAWWRALLVPAYWWAQRRALRAALAGSDAPSRVVAHMFLPCGLAVARECARRGVPFEVFGHGTDVDVVLRLPARLRRFLLAPLLAADSIHLPSADKLERLVAALGLADAPPNFHLQTMVESVPVPSRPRVAREALAEPRLLFVGRLIRQKGVDLLLEAVAALDRELPVDIAGDGPERSRLEERAHRLGLRVRFHGFVERDALAQLYAEADVLCVPSRECRGLSEGAPLVIPEALAYGITVVASEVGGIPELCASRPRCLLAPPGDSAALARVIGRALAALRSHEFDEATPAARHVA